MADHIPHVSMVRVAHLGPRWRASCSCGWMTSPAAKELAEREASIHLNTALKELARGAL